MKKISIQISFDEEKAKAITMVLQKKNSSINFEIETFMEGLYKRVVPVAVREFIEMKDTTGQGKDVKQRKES